MHPRRFRTRLTAGFLLALVIGGLVASPVRVSAQRDNGLTSDTSYESPEFGYEIEWDDPWVAEEDDTESTRDGDSLSLTSEGAYIGIYGFEYAGDPADAVAIILESVEESADEVEIIDEDGDDHAAYAEITFELEGTDVTEYVEARPVGNGASVVVTLTAPSALYDDELDSANDLIEFERDPIFATLTSGGDSRATDDDDDTRDRTEDEDDDGRGRQLGDDDDDDSRRNDDDEDEDEDRQSRSSSGVDGSAYVSPTYGYSIEWGRDWEFAE